MWFYLAVLLITAALAAPLHWVKGPARRSAMYLALVFVVLAVVSGTRELAVGTDTWYYAEAFADICSKGFDGMAGTHYEVGYYLLNMLVGFFTSDFRVFLVIESALTLGLVLLFVHRNSLNPVVSVLLFQELYFFCASMNMSRAWLSIAIALAGFEFVRKRRLVPALLFVALGMAFHTAVVLMGVVFLVVYFARNLSEGASIAFGLLAMFLVLAAPLAMQAVAAVLPRYVYYLDSYFGSERSAGMFSTFIVALVACVYVLGSGKLGGEQGGMVKALSVCLLIGAGCAYATNGFPIATRVSAYFQVMMVLYVPLVAKQLEYGKILQYGTVAAMAIYYVTLLGAGNAGVVPYETWLW